MITKHFCILMVNRWNNINPDNCSFSPHHIVFCIPYLTIYRSHNGYCRKFLIITCRILYSEVGIQCKGFVTIFPLQFSSLMWIITWRLLILRLIESIIILSINNFWVETTKEVRVSIWYHFLTARLEKILSFFPFNNFVLIFYHSISDIILSHY